MTERLRSIDAFQIYSSIKLHFTKPTYDAKKYNYKVRANEKTFLKRPDKYQFGKLASKYQYPNKLIIACVASFVYGETKWAGDVLTYGEDRLNMLKKNVQSLHYVFEQDCYTIAQIMNDKKYTFADCINNKNDLPLLYRLMIKGDISMETVCIFEKELKILTNILNDETLKLVAGDVCLRVKKYAEFIQYDKQKVANIIVNHLG